MKHITKGVGSKVKQKENAANTPLNRREPITPEARESKVVAAAYDLAEQRILAGTASSAEIVHFLEIGSPLNKLKREKAEEEVRLLKAKRESLEAEKKSVAEMENVLAALKRYKGINDNETEDYSAYLQ